MSWWIKEGRNFSICGGTERGCSAVGSYQEEDREEIDWGLVGKQIGLIKQGGCGG